MDNFWVKFFDGRFYLGVWVGCWKLLRGFKRQVFPKFLSHNTLNKKLKFRENFDISKREFLIVWKREILTVSKGNFWRFWKGNFDSLKRKFWQFDKEFSLNAIHYFSIFNDNYLGLGSEFQFHTIPRPQNISIKTKPLSKIDHTKFSHIFLFHVASNDIFITWKNYVKIIFCWFVCLFG